MSLLRPLHDERRDYVVAWDGRVQPPAPPLPRTLPKYAQVKRPTRGRPSSEEVRAVLTDEWQRVWTVASTLGIQWRTAKDLLWQLERQGHADRQDRIGPTGKRHVWYRRRQR